MGSAKDASELQNRTQVWESRVFLGECGEGWGRNRVLVRQPCRTVAGGNNGFSFE